MVDQQEQLPVTGARRHPHVVRRRPIIEAARDVIVRQGIAGTRLRDLAAAAQVSLGTLTYHFSGMDEVLAGVIEAEETDFFMPLKKEALEAPSGREGLRHLVDGLFNNDPRTREHWLIWLNFWALATRDPRYGAWQHASYQSWQDCVTELVERGQLDDSLIVDDVALSVCQFMALVDGIAGQAYLVRQKPTVAAETPNAVMWRLVAHHFEIPTGPMRAAASHLTHPAETGGDTRS